MTGNVDLRAIQEPLKESYREHPDSGRITLTARGATGDTPIACSVDLGRAVYEAQAHAGVGGEGTGACSGDLLLGALAACAQITCQMVAEAMGLEVNDIAVTVEGDLDLRGTLGIDREAPVGFTDIRVSFRDRRSRSDRGAAGRAASQDRALLRGHADADDGADHHRRLGAVTPNFDRAFDERPQVQAAWLALNRSIKESMDLRRYELATLAAAQRLRSSYCCLAHGKVLIDSFGEPVREIALDRRGAGLDEVDIAVMDLAEQVVDDATAIGDQHLARLRELGLPEPEIRGVVLAAAARCFFSKTLDALDIRADASYSELDPALLDVLVVGRPISTA